jgi:DMSO/TMAO reductase YedYZ molybdopterin-dependent catalytic subunit
MTNGQPAGDPEWVHGHPHEPNPIAPSGDGSLTVCTPDGREQFFTVEDLRTLPYTEVPDCYIISTGHGATGPFTFGGVCLVDLLAYAWPPEQGWRYIDVMGADGFGARLTARDLELTTAQRPIVLAYQRNGLALSRKEGLVRLVAPTALDDALLHVKWVERIQIAG